MKLPSSCIVLACLFYSCGPSGETGRITEFDLRTPSNLEVLKPKIERVIGSDSVAHQYIADYERELEKYIPPERKYEVIPPPRSPDLPPPLPKLIESYSYSNFEQFNKRTLIQSMITLDRASASFLQTHDLPTARLGVAIGYVALCSSPNPSEMTIIVNKMLPLLDSLQGKR